MNNFEKSIKNPEAWFRQAWEMFEASRAIFDLFYESRQPKTEKENHKKNGLMKSSMLLLGLALENALKGAIVNKSKPDLSKGFLQTSIFSKKAHELKQIAEKLNLELDDEDAELLDRLSMFVQWGAKYNAPKSKGEYEQWIGNRRMEAPIDFHAVEKMINKLQLQCGYCQNSGWPER